ncbi:hypothetical protein l11_12920 [Neisseria weaveri LMG 5135]|nr:hypothetical protein l11_12920 [Neisseria weaveri LMG 5135]
MLKPFMYLLFVSTHSRPKAAVRSAYSFVLRQQSFNTQPPEGGCLYLG